MSKSFYKKNDTTALINFAQDGDIKALEELIRRVQKDIYSIFSHLTSRKDDVSDLTQEVLLKMAKSITSLKDARNFKSWLNRIITNTFYDFSKRKPEQIVELDEDKFNEIRDKLGCEPGDRCLFTELEKLIKLALMTLPKDLRLSIVLREFEGLSYEDIARATNTTLGTVKSRISRARIKLQEELRDFI